MVKICLLKYFGTVKINKYTKYKEHPNPKLLYVWFQNDWHTVPKKDVTIITQ